MVNMLDYDLIKKDFVYIDGELYRKCGTLNKNGYHNTKYKEKIYRSHRLIFFYHYGYLPKCIDHIDGNKSNNKIENLREATYSQNLCNRRTLSNNTSGAKNIRKVIYKNNVYWRVVIRKNNKSVYDKRFKDIELAELVAIMAREKYHGNFARHN